MRKGFAFKSFMFWLLLLPGLASAQVLSVVTLNWEPFYGEKLQDQGVVSDIVRAAFAIAGYDTRIEFIPWERALERTRNLKSDVLMGLWYSSERDEVYHFSAPFLSNRIVFVKRSDDDYEFEGLASLGDRRIGIVRSYAYAEQFDQSQTLRKFAASNLASNLKKLAANRIDLTLGDELVIRDELNKNLPQLKQQLAFTTNAITEKPLYISVSREHPQGEAIIQAFNQGLQAIRQSGAYREILQKHGFR